MILRGKKMRFEDNNFEKEFIKWLNSKTEEEIIEDFKKITDEQVNDFK